MTESDFLATPARTGSPFAFVRIRDGDDGPVPFLPGDGTKIRFASRAADTLTLTGLPRGFLASGDRVSVSYLGTTVFVGDVTRIVRRDGAGTDATDQVTCCGPWETMSRLVYRQYWATSTGSELSSRLVLNQSSGGSAQSLDSELREIAEHGATPCGYSVGTVSVSSQCLPYDECRDITVADAIRRELRFFPRAVTRFNYSGETPSLSIVRVAADGADAAYIATIPKTERTYEINANPIDAVDLEIEETGDVQGVPYRKITHDKTMGDTSPVNPGCLYATLQIAGSSASTVRQTFKSVTEDIPADLTDASWWNAHVAASAITIVEASRSGEATKAQFPRISAASAGELAEAGLRCRVEKFEAKVKIDAGADVEEELYLTMNFLTTNATGTAANPRKYTWTVESSSAAAETVPNGLAAAILADRSGSLRAARMTARLGSSLPQIGDLHQGLILQTFEVDCGDLTADLEFGAPEYLSPEDMASLLSGFRNKSRATCAASRISGKKADDGNAEVEMGGIPPLSSTEFEPGRKTKMTIGGSSSGSSASASSSITMDTTGGGGNVDVDTADIPRGETVAVKTLTITGAGANGANLTFKILSNDDVTINPGAARTPLSTTAPQDAVLSTGTASAGGAGTTTASKSDHVHKLPNTVVDTVNDQDIFASKSFKNRSLPNSRVTINAGGIEITDVQSPYAGKISSEYGHLVLGSTSTETHNDYDRPHLAESPNQNASKDSHLIVDVGWVNNHFVAGDNISITEHNQDKLKISATGSGGVDISALNGVTLVTNVEWTGSPTYVIRVTKRTASVANGVLTLGAAQTSDIQTTPLSGESSGGTSI